MVLTVERELGAQAYVPLPTEAASVESVESGRIPSFQQSDEEVVLRCQCRFKAECGLWSENVASYLPDNFWPQVDSGPNWVAMMQKLVFFGYWRVVCWRVFTNTSPALLAVRVCITGPQYDLVLKISPRFEVDYRCQATSR